MIYIGNFLFVTNQQSSNEADRRHGEFNLVVDAGDEPTAITKFKERIAAFRTSSSFFEGECSVYFTKMLQFGEFPKDHAKMINYKSFAGDPIMPFIECTLPSAESNACTILEWDRNTPELDGKKNKVFVEFKIDS
ncbi:MAG: hypothetical protein HKM93_06560 [Desulfobacteraceae bacterium]|nr:hypothetical protein [Desulfobacteraceae bacterium]